MVHNLPATVATPSPAPRGAAPTPVKTPMMDQNSATPVVSFDQIESQKENIQPIARGRSASKLSNVISLQFKERQAALAEGRAEFEREIHSEENAESDDPLDAYNRYVQWTVENYPQGHNHDSNLVPLLELATHTFKDSEQYRNDSRYLKLWVLYARNVDVPRDIYSFLMANDIGTKLATLYEEYAITLEEAGFTDQADQTYLLGIHRRAMPLERLKRRYAEFQQRILLRPQGSETQPVTTPRSRPTAPSGLGSAMGSVGRSVLGVKSSGRGPTASLAASSGAQARPASSAPNGARMGIFVDPTGEAAEEASRRGQWDDVGTVATRRRENTEDGPLPWKGELLPQKRGGARMPSTPKLEVFRDGASHVLDALRSARKTSKPSSFALASRTKPSKDKSSSSKGGAAEKVVVDLALLYPSLVGREKAEMEKVLVDSHRGSSRRKRTREESQHEEFSMEECIASKIGQRRWENEDDDMEMGVWLPRRETRRKIEEAAPVLELAQTTLSSKRSTSALVTPSPIAEGVAVPVRSKTSPSAPILDLDVSMINSPSIAQAANKSAQLQPLHVSPDSSTSASASALAPAPTPAASNAGSSSVDLNLLKDPRPPSPTVVTKAMTMEVMGMFNGDEDEDDEDDDDDSDEEDSDEDEDEDEEEEEGQDSMGMSDAHMAPPLRMMSSAGLVPHSPTPAERRFDENGERVSGSMGSVLRPKAARTPLAAKPIVEEDEREEEAEDQSVKGDEQDEPPKDGANVMEEPEPLIDLGEGGGEASFETSYAGGGRWVNGPLGPYTVMTPITERTYEFTNHTNWTLAPSNGTDRRVSSFGSRPSFPSFDSQSSAEQLQSGKMPVKRLSVPDASQEPAKEVGWGTAVLQDLPNPCCPTDEETLRKILTSLNPPLETRPDFVDLRMTTANKLDCLQKRARQVSRRSVGSSGRGGSGAGDDEPWEVEIGGDVFSVREKLGEGGFGAVFLVAGDAPDDADEGRSWASDLDDETGGKDESRLVAVKVERPGNLWEFHVLKCVRDKLPPHTLSSVVRPRKLYAYGDESFLMMDYKDHGTLLDAVNQSSKEGSSTPGLDEVVVMFFAIELLKIVEALHSAGFIHGDLKIDNCLLRLEEPQRGTTWSNAYAADGSAGWSSKGVTLIDFGRAINTTIFPADQQFIADWPVDNKDCVEMREARPWTYQTDYYGLAGIVYCMLFGKFIETTTTTEAESKSDGQHEPTTKHKIGQPLKRYWQVDLWTRLFDALLNPRCECADGSLPITSELAALRKEMETWLEANANRGGKNLKGALKKVEIRALEMRGRAK